MSAQVLALQRSVVIVYTTVPSAKELTAGVNGQGQQMEQTDR